MTKLQHKLSKTMDALWAFKVGATDSGVHDPELEKALGQALRDMDSKECNEVCMARIVAMIAHGTNLDEIKDFIAWVENDLLLPPPKPMDRQGSRYYSDFPWGQYH